MANDKALCERLRAEYNGYAQSNKYSDSDKTRLLALVNFADDNINSFSPATVEFLTGYAHPLDALKRLWPFSLVTDKPDQTYNETGAAGATDHIERRVRDILNMQKEMQDMPGSAPETSFERMIEKIMPEVAAAGDDPFMIYRDAAGGWHGDFAQNRYGETFYRAEDVINADKAAFLARGQDFGSARKQDLYNDVLCQRLRNEYYNVSSYDMDAEHKKIYALLNFFEDNVINFSPKTLEYLTELARPLDFLSRACPYNLATGREEWAFNKDLAPDAIDAIERKAEELIEIRDEAELNKQIGRDIRAAGESEEFGGDIVRETRTADGYKIISALEIGGVRVLLTDNPDSPGGYAVRDYSRSNDFGIEECTYRAVYDNYLDAVFRFNNSVMVQVEALQAERKERRANGVEPYTLTVSDCVPGGLDEDLTGKLIVIKPDVLAAEYRNCDYQLKIALNGFGCSPNARGTAVFCEDVYTGKTSRFERYDAVGVLDPARTPEWARAKLALREALKEPGVFEFGAYHFKPERQFRKGEVAGHLKGDSRPDQPDMQYAMRNMASDFAVGLNNYHKDNVGWSYVAFYAAAGETDKKTDIFRCLETGKLYVPAENELFGYNEPPVKERAEAPAPPKPAKPEAATEKPQKKPSILDDLDASVKEAAERAERKGGANTKKRGDLEVE